MASRCVLKKTLLSILGWSFREEHIFSMVLGDPALTGRVLNVVNPYQYPSSYVIFKLARKRKASRRSAPPVAPAEVVQPEEDRFDAETRAKLKFADNALKLIGLGINNKKEKHRLLTECHKKALKAVQVTTRLYLLLFNFQNYKYFTLNF